MKESVEKRASLLQLLKEHKPIWVINRTAKVLNEGVYVFLRLGENARGIKIDPVPPGDDPICLTDKVPHKYLEECADLFRFVDRGLLEVISHEEAEAYYSKNPEARKRLEMKIQSLTQPSEGIGRGFREMIGRKVMKPQAEGVAVSAGEKDEPSPRVRWLVGAYEGGVLNIEAIKVELMAYKDLLTNIDKDYLKQKIKDPKLLQDIV